MLYLEFWDSLLVQWSGRARMSLSEAIYYTLLSLSNN
jgi:hypothetical protein